MMVRETLKIKSVGAAETVMNVEKRLSVKRRNEAYKRSVCGGNMSYYGSNKQCMHVPVVIKMYSIEPGQVLTNLLRVLAVGVLHPYVEL